LKAKAELLGAQADLARQGRSRESLDQQMAAPISGSASGRADCGAYRRRRVFD
jgi:hypothetical protein